MQFKIIGEICSKSFILHFCTTSILLTIIVIKTRRKASFEQFQMLVFSFLVFFTSLKALNGLICTEVPAPSEQSIQVFFQ
jgi:hypothetical protein